MSKFDAPLPLSLFALLGLGYSLSAFIGMLAEFLCGLEIYPSLARHVQAISVNDSSEIA